MGVVLLKACAIQLEYDKRAGREIARILHPEVGTGSQPCGDI